MNKMQAIVSAGVILIILLYIVVFLPPSNIYFILIFTALFSSLIFIISDLLIKTKVKYLPAIFVFLFLTISYLAGFQIVNTLLLFSFIIGLFFLIR